MKRHGIWWEVLFPEKTFFETAFEHQFLSIGELKRWFFKVTGGGFLTYQKVPDWCLKKSSSHNNSSHGTGQQG